MSKYILDTRFDGAKSFYYKAVVFEEHSDGFTDSELFSYETKVAYVRKNNSNGDLIIRIYGGEYDYDNLSNTTCRHIREFLRQMLDDGEIKFSKDDLKKMHNKYTKYKKENGSYVKYGSCEIK